MLAVCLQEGSKVLAKQSLSHRHLNFLYLQINE